MQNEQEVHEPRPGERYFVTKTEESETHRDYFISGENNGRKLAGTLTLLVEDGDFDGYRWENASDEFPEPDEDGLQALLDLFA